MEEIFESVRQRPALALRPYVAWYSGYRQVGGVPGRHRGLPSPYVTLIVTLDEPIEVVVPSDPRQAPHTYDTLVGGLHRTPTIIAHPGRQSGIQVSLEPLGIRALLGLPAAELANIDVQMTDVLGPLARELHARVREARSWDDRFAVLDSFLLRRLEGGRLVSAEIVGAWQRLKQTGGCLEVAELADAVGWSSRHLSERFYGELGLSPKVAARVIRFDRARRQIQRQLTAGSPGTLADLAAECGFYDQAHLAREFREIAGCSASQWVAEEFRNFQAYVDDDDSD